MTEDMYSYARLGGIDFGLFRFPGMGLGNLLFPWARFMVATRKHHLIPICPTWFQIKIGPILRNESDKRFYHGLFQNPPGHITGYQKLYLLNALKKVKESDLEQFLQQKNSIKQNVVVVFSGMTGQFAPILKDHGFILAELLKITRQEHKQGFTESFRKIIGVHVRRGDFASPENERVLVNGSVNYRIPLSWYIRQIKQLREVVGTDIPVHIFSDGTDEELSELFELHNVKRMNFGSSLADLLALSQSGILIASGSTFSMWASYLGRMPVIWHKGQLKQRLYYEMEGMEIECDHHSKLPESFINHLESKFLHHPCASFEL